MNVRQCDPVDITAIAERAGVTRQTVDMWRYRHQTGQHPFPAPKWYPDRHPLWEWAAIDAWLTATGRGDS